MSKTVPAALQTHLDTQQTTLAYLLKITPVVGSAFGVTSLDQDIDYDDGGGSLTYSSATGMNQSSVENSAELSVNNSEAMLLIGTDLSKADIAGGVLDYASFVVYRINWSDLSNGHYLVQSGKVGAVRSQDNLSGVIELRSTQQELKQNFIDLYSLGCRASFGSQPGEEKFPCNFDAAALLQNDVVASIGTETDREFTTTDTPAATGPNGALTFETALVIFLTGANAGLTVETETVVGKDITLRFNAAYAIEVGDTFQIRPDCRKRYAEDCIAAYANGENFRGEPLIPLTEENAGQSVDTTLLRAGLAKVEP